MLLRLTVPVLIVVCLVFSTGAVAVPNAHANVHPKSAARQQAPNSGQTTASQNAYLARLRGKILNNWYLPDGKNSVEITATVNADGSIDQVQVTSTPKSDPAEQAASDAFSKAQPLEGLPAGMAKATIVLSFVSSADPHGDSSSNVTTKMTPQPAQTKTPVTGSETK